MPVGRPALSRTISPPGTSFTSSPTLAARIAAVFASDMWPSSRLIHTGLSGVTASIQSRDGSSPPHSVWSQSPPVIHAPRLLLLGELADAADELVARAGVAKLHRRQPQAAVDQVDVRIDQPRHDQPVAGVDHLRLVAAILLQLLARADGHDLFVAHGNGLGPRAVRVGRPDAALE